MALPTLSKSWTFNCNNAIAAQGTVLADCQALLFAIISALLATGKWTVAYSCNSTTAGTAGDGVNRWASAANLVWSYAGDNHSWIVLKNTNMPGGNYQLCFDLSSTTATIMSVVRSVHAGFTGGSTTARPTAADKVTLLSDAYWGGPSPDAAMRWSTLVSTDGQCTRIVIAGGGSLLGFLYFDRTTNEDAGTTYPFADYIVGAASGPVTLSITATKTYPLAVSGTGSVGFVSQLTDLASPSSINSNWPIVPACLIGTTSGAFGYLGMFQDMWIGSGSVATGDSYPGAPNWTASKSYPTAGKQVTNGSNVYTLVTPGTSASSGGPTGTGSSITDGTCVWAFFSAKMQFVQVGQYVLPWNGGAFNLT